MSPPADMSVYPSAQEAYAALGVDTEQAISKLASIPLSLHCWQGDDVGGFEKEDSVLSGGGIQATGNYPGKARSLAQLRDDLDRALSLIPGRHRLNLHACYADLAGEKVERNDYSVRHFQTWIDWCAERGLGLDFNPTLLAGVKNGREALAHGLSRGAFALPCGAL